jgi:hypothetical protein
MDERRHAPSTHLGPCGQLRLQADSACARAADLKQAAIGARETLITIRRDLARVQHALEEARVAADPARISHGKTEARAVYRRTIQAAGSPADRQRAATVWLKEIDRLNREARRANRALSRAEGAARQLTRGVVEAERRSDAARIAAESAQMACAEAREDLANCESSPESMVMPESPGRRAADRALAAARERAVATAAADAAAAGDSGTAPSAAGPRRPLVVERLMFGDRDAIQAVAREVSTITGQPTSHYMLLLHELIDAVRQVAGEQRFLAFADAHPLWSQFDNEERRAIVTALWDLGFRYDAEDGWFGGRIPGTNDMAIALAYAGHDPRTIRRQPTPDELRTLPESIVVSPLECLSALAPDLTLAQLFELLGPRADSLGALWDDWGRLRPLLLSPADALVAA